MGKDYIKSRGARRHESLVSRWRMLQDVRMILCLPSFSQYRFFFSDHVTGNKFTDFISFQLYDHIRRLVHSW